MIFTTSWDDGRKDELRVAALLEKYGAKGTFYVLPPNTHEQEALSKNDIQELSKTHEIGAHSITHPKLTRLSPEKAREEIEESKQWVEGITGKECSMFCYPYGDYDPSVCNLVRAAGFKGARTVEHLQFATSDPFALPTTLQVYPFPFRRKFTRWWHPLDPVARLRIFYPRMRSLGLPLSATFSWLRLAKALFHYALQTNQPFFHLWGHGWEVERYGMWDSLEKFLKYVKEQDNVAYSVNSGLLL